MIIIINALVDNIIVISCVACSSGLLVMIYTGSIPVTSTLIHGFGLLPDSVWVTSGVTNPTLNSG